MKALITIFLLLPFVGYAQGLEEKKLFQYSNYFCFNTLEGDFKVDTTNNIIEVAKPLLSDKFVGDTLITNQGIIDSVLSTASEWYKNYWVGKDSITSHVLYTYYQWDEDSQSFSMIGQQLNQPRTQYPNLVPLNQFMQPKPPKLSAEYQQYLDQLTSGKDSLTVYQLYADDLNNDGQKELLTCLFKKGTEWDAQLPIYHTNTRIEISGHYDTPHIEGAQWYHSITYKGCLGINQLFTIPFNNLPYKVIALYGAGGVMEGDGKALYLYFVGESRMGDTGNDCDPINCY